MAKIRLVLVASLVIMLVALSPFTVSAKSKTLYIGGTMALTGAYAEDTAAVLAAYQDYVKYVNETRAFLYQEGTVGDGFSLTPVPGGVSMTASA